ncbi:MAG: NADH-quinone oxidoreductase subunit J [Acidimicrobiia bacterium]
MSTSLAVDIAFWAFSAGSVVAAWLVFRTDSMVRAAYWLLASFAAVGAVMVLLHARFLGLVLVLMMAGEMTIMAVFMVMFMMNPAGLNPMTMVHQHRTAKIAGVVAFAGLALVGLVADFPDRPADSGRNPTADLGRELLGDSMLIFETAGVTLLATMIGALALASKRGRYGDAEEGSAPPPLEPVADASAGADTVTEPATDTGDHAGKSHG